MRVCTRNGCGRRHLAFLPGRSAGVTLDGEWYCSPSCVEQITRDRLIALEPTRPAARRTGSEDALRMRLGGWLRHTGALTEDQLALAVETQAKTGLKFGEQVLALKLASPDAVLRALALQAGVRYLSTLSLATVRRGPGGLSPDAVRALAIIPFSEPVGGVIKVACLAPLPRLALGAFRRITGFIPEPHLVADERWTSLMDAYGAEADQPATSTFVETRDLAEAAATIARTATHGRAARLTELRCDPYTWVRVFVPNGVHDVVYAAPRGF
jgi:hypothetical protein